MRPKRKLHVHCTCTCENEPRNDLRDLELFVDAKAHESDEENQHDCQSKFCSDVLLNSQHVRFNFKTLTDYLDN